MWGFLLSFFLKYWSRIALGAGLALLVGGFSYKTFIQSTSSSTFGPRSQMINNYGEPRVPLIGCAAWKFYVGVDYKPAPKVEPIPGKKKRHD